MKGKFFLALFVCLVSIGATVAQNIIKVDEAAVQIIPGAKAAEIRLVVENPNDAFDGKMRFEGIDVGGKIRAAFERVERIENGEKTYKIAAPFADLLQKNADEIGWFRLRYRIADTNRKIRSSGIVSFSEILRDVFKLRVVAARNVFAGMNFRARVRAFNPFSGEPVGNVKVGGEVKFKLDTDAKNDELKIRATGATNAEGFANLEFKIPNGARLDDDGNLKIVGTKYGIEREVETDLSAATDNFSVYLNTDKPLYQPGQSFNARGILMRTGIGQNTIVGDAELEFIIRDEEETILYRETVKTSRFGIAAVSWQIPDNAKLGTYRVETRTEDDSNAREEFKVSRYDLPNFTVAVKADRDFYLPEKSFAEVEIRADYLFGKPVAKGSVKIVQEAEREWNYREQKWIIEEEREFKGETGADGKLKTKIDLTEAFAKFAGSDYRRYEDLNFAAYFTDQTTNRTEQRRFDLRVSKEAVHVYLVGSTYNQNPFLPQTLYVSTFYADGSPAACDVEVLGHFENESQTTEIARLKTNRLGAGRIQFTAPPRENYDKKLQLEIKAIDVQKRFGTLEETIDFDAGDALRIEIDKTIYKPGEPIKARIVSTKKDALLYVDIARDWSVLKSEITRLKDGRAEIKIPYQAAFKGDLTVAAYVEKTDADGDADLIRDSRGVIFPAPNNLNLSANFSRDAYRPNEEAKINFSVLAPDKTPLQSALGIVVFDKAIEERARTDADFGGNLNLFKNFDGLLGYDKNFGSLTRRDLDELDLSKPISEDLQAAAEIMFYDNYYAPEISESVDAGQAQKIFAGFFKKQIAPAESALKNAYLKNFAHPIDDATLLKILAENNIDFSNLRDPWATNYRAVYEIEKDKDILRFVSAGADKKFDTADDFSVLGLQFEYFLPVGMAIDRAVKNYHGRTNAFIRDRATLKAELAKQNIDLDALRDRWNQTYRIEFEVNKSKYAIRFHSVGANGVFDANEWDSDDFDVWTNEIEYFSDTENLIQNRLEDYAKKTKTFPQDAETFDQFLKQSGIDETQLKDGYDRRAYLTANIYLRYADRVKIENTGKVGEKTAPKTTVEPVTQQVAALKLRSAGADAVEGTDDDFDLATFSGVISEQGKTDAQPQKPHSIVATTGAKGAIRGTIKDAGGAVISGATVVAVGAEAEKENDADEEETSEEFSAVSNDEGVYVIENLPSGKYKLTTRANGFNPTILTDVLVRSKSITEADFNLQIGGVAQTVEVSAGVSAIDTSTANGYGRGEGNGTGGGGGGGKEEKKEVSNNKTAPENSTPRLREYFPETLVWQPEIITDKNGRAELKFKLGDNITTWKMYAIASDARGKIGVAAREIRAFQPFFAELEPPKFLTVGDEIFLPAQIRNYTEKAQTVDVKMAGGAWFNFLDAAEKRVEVAADNSANAVFGFRAEKIIKDGKQRVTAIAGKDSDAIEKPVTVNPNGREITATKSEIFRDAAAFDVDFPANALADTRQATLKIYPNLLAHVADSIEGLLQRPYGCGEQTVSSTYPNLMIMKFAPKDGKIYKAAEKYLQKGYERLLGYQTADGGFAVWTKDAPDVALTAYALRFLIDARAFVGVDEDVIKRAESWLVKQQRADGSWTRKYDWENSEDERRTKLITTYAARTLAMTTKNAEAKSETAAALQKALDYLKARNAEIDEPYALALFGLASLDAGNTDDAQQIAARLETMAKTEGAGAYWNLETNTPFYGWGTAGRIETTALVVQLLLKVQGSKFNVQSQSESKISNLKSEIEKQKTNDEKQTTNLVSKGTQFLLKNKDRYGVWYSTQTTINVLDAFLAAISDDDGKAANENRAAEIFVNNKKIKDVSLPPTNTLAFPIGVELPVGANQNRVEIKVGGGKNSLMAQIVQTHYVGWQDFSGDGRDENQSRALRFAYDCDKKTARPTEEISCHVGAERIGFKDYGMLLAEIGLPPGADVDRASLEKAREENWNFSRYDVLPDRIVVYLWAQAGGTRINFKFRPRYGINAQTAPSLLYDYYNPEARATLAPLKFSVKE